MSDHDVDCPHGRSILIDCAACAHEAGFRAAQPLREDDTRSAADVQAELIHDEHGPAAPAPTAPHCSFPLCECDMYDNGNFECRKKNPEVFRPAAIPAMYFPPGFFDFLAECASEESFDPEKLLESPMSDVTLPTDAKARKAIPLARGVLDYFPNALAAVAELSRIGNEQHNPGQPMHWAKEKSTDHADCILRHMADRGTLDTDKVRHSTKIAWRGLANLEIEILAERGDPEAIRQVKEMGTRAQVEALKKAGLIRS